MMLDIIIVWPSLYSNVTPSLVYWFDLKLPTCRNTSQQGGYDHNCDSHCILVRDTYSLLKLAAV